MVSSDSNKKKPSVSSQPNTAALVTVSGSELDFYTNSNYLAYELPQYAAAQRAGKLGNDVLDEDPTDPGEGDESGEGDEATGGDKENTTGRPSLSDIQIISNEVVLDAANIPTAKVVFKVRNSSGVELKAIFVRVEEK